eukprot:767777-Hanusia_phi.AAC.3
MVSKYKTSMIRPAQLRRFTILTEQFSLQNGTLLDEKRVNRQKVFEMFSDVFDTMFDAVFEERGHDECRHGPAERRVEAPRLSDDDSEGSSERTEQQDPCRDVETSMNLMMDSPIGNLSSSGQLQTPRELGIFVHSREPRPNVFRRWVSNVIDLKHVPTHSLTCVGFNHSSTRRSSFTSRAAVLIRKRSMTTSSTPDMRWSSEPLRGSKPSRMRATMRSRRRQRKSLTPPLPSSPSTGRTRRRRRRGRLPRLRASTVAGELALMLRADVLDSSADELSCCFSSQGLTSPPRPAHHREISELALLSADSHHLQDFYSKSFYDTPPSPLAVRRSYPRASCSHLSYQISPYEKMLLHDPKLLARSNASRRLILANETVIANVFNPPPHQLFASKFSDISAFPVTYV